MTDTPNTDVLAARAREVLAASFVTHGFPWSAEDTMAGATRLGPAIIAAMIAFAKEATPQSDGTAIPAGFVLTERKLDDECGCPEEMWDTPYGELHMHLSAGKASNACLDNGDEGERHIDLTTATADEARAAIFAWAAYPATAPKVASDTMREALERIERVMRTNIHENDGPDRIWLDGVAHEGPLASWAIRCFRKVGDIARAALSVQSPANAGQDGDLLEQAAVIAEAHEPMGFMSDREREYCREHGQEIADRIRIRALNPTKDAQS